MKSPLHIHSLISHNQSFATNTPPLPSSEHDSLVYHGMRPVEKSLCGNLFSILKSLLESDSSPIEPYIFAFIHRQPSGPPRIAHHPQTHAHTTVHPFTTPSPAISNTNTTIPNPLSHHARPIPNIQGRSPPNGPRRLLHAHRWRIPQILQVRSPASTDVGGPITHNIQP